MKPKLDGGNLDGGVRGCGIEQLCWNEFVFYGEDVSEGEHAIEFSSCMPSDYLTPEFSAGASILVSEITFIPEE